MNKPIEGEWYWVTDGKAVWVAEHRPPPWYVHGWGNRDTWEDWNGDVVAWGHIPKPTAQELLAKRD